MTIPDLVRALAATGAAVAAGGASLAFGAPGEAALMTALITCVGTWFAFPGPIKYVESHPELSGDQRLIESENELIEAIDDPLLLVERHIVARANAAARALLGQHILGEDIRLAI